MKGHITDRTLDNLLDGSLDQDDEVAIEEHARKCSSCATRLREWQILFPQIRSLIPSSEQPVYAGTASAGDGPLFVPTPRPASLNVFVPDWTPPAPSHRISPIRAMWGVVLVLALGAGYLMFRRMQSDSMDSAYGPTDLEPAPAAVDSTGIGSGMPGPEESAAIRERLAAEIRDSIAAVNARSQVAEPPATVASVTNRADAPATEVERPITPREEPAHFPIRAEQGPGASPGASQGEDTAAAVASAPSSPPVLPTEFTRVSLGEAISALSGTVRLIQGMTPETVEVAQGTILPGADPKRAVVRVVYNTSEGRIILDQQRLDRSQGGEPSIAVSTTPGGVSVAQWVDRGGFWISLAGRTDQTNLLAIANRIR